MEVAPDGKLVITACRVEPSKTDADRECVRWCHGLARPTSTARRHATAEPSGTSVSAEARESASRQHSARRSLIPSIRRRSAARRADRRAQQASHRWSGWSPDTARSEEHTPELQSLMRISYAVFCLKKKKYKNYKKYETE